MTDSYVFVISVVCSLSVIAAFAGGLWYFRRLHRAIQNGHFTTTTFILFLDRPNGGMEFESWYGVAALWFGVVFAITPDAVENLRTTRDLAWVVPHYVLAIPWLISSACTLVGLVLFAFGNPLCAPLRWIGSFIATFIWAVMFARASIETGGALPTLIFYFIGMVWSPRVMMSSWGRCRRAWKHRGDAA